MIIEVKIPTPGESITEVDLSSWLVDDGDIVLKDQEIAEIESDKATLPLIAEKTGKIRILIAQGETVPVGTIACTIDTSDISETGVSKDRKEEITPAVSESSKEDSRTGKVPEQAGKKARENLPKITPLARKMMEEEDLEIKDLDPGTTKVTTKAVRLALEKRKATGTRKAKRESMTQLRRKLAKRLVAVKNETAMLTTFNEADMSTVIELRKKHQESFIAIHGVKLGFMSFFVKAASLALKEFPRVNSMLDGDDIIIPEYIDISIAVQTDKGLMVPVLRNTETMGLADIEKAVLNLAEKARNFRLSIDEMTGGTFSITNGGIFGSMLSTPIINPPQSGILGMHNIVERPVAIEGEVKIRPVMYLALSYDHRIIDGRDSVGFLVRVKELIEDPLKMLPEETEKTDKNLLGIQR